MRYFFSALLFVFVSLSAQAWHPPRAPLALNELVSKADHDSAAALALAAMYENGQGVVADRHQALMWRRRAAELGDVTAQLDLARRYESGRGAPKDLREGEVWYERAAKSGGERRSAPVARDRARYDSNEASHREVERAIVGDPIMGYGRSDYCPEPPLLRGPCVDYSPYYRAYPRVDLSWGIYSGWAYPGWWWNPYPYGWYAWSRPLPHRHRHSRSRVHFGFSFHN